MNITTEEIKALEETKSERDWITVCDNIKRARSGSYPPDWWDKIMLSGLMLRITLSW